MIWSFKYLNSEIVDEFLGQIEGGLVDVISSKTQNTGEGSRGAKVGVNSVGVEASKKSSFMEEQEHIISQTSSSKFARLYKYASDDDLMIIDSIDEREFLSGINKQVLCEFVDVDLKISGFQAASQIADQILDLALKFEAFGIKDFDNSSKEQMENVASLTDNAKPLGTIATIKGNAKAKIAMELERQYLRAGVDIEGEVTVLLKVSKILKQNETVMVGDPTDGVSKNMNRLQRREMLKGFKKSNTIDLTKPEIGFPGIVATVVAVY